jgi:tRNA(Arg) A34 adenosine deaminase TadA
MTGGHAEADAQLGTHLTAHLIARLLDVIEHDIVPKTRQGVARGDKIFGAAILAKSDLSLVLSGTNAETENPMWHGEVHTLKQFYELSAAERPAPEDCLFLATHEPCSLCLSAITWTGFDNFYYLFGYEDTEGKFAIPHDLRILHEVFGVEQGAYRRENAFWTSHGIGDAISRLDDESRERLTERTGEVDAIYAALSTAYQASKGTADIPLP